MSSIQEISKIKFGIYSTEEIHKLSVCEVNNPKLSGCGSVYDENMGPIDNNITCPQCGEDNKKCPGHYGHIDLNYPIIHPMYYKYVTMILKCVCNKCYKFLFNEDNLQILGFDKYTGETRFNKIVESIEKIDICPYCCHVLPKIQYSSTENLIYFNYKSKTETFKTLLLESDILNIFENISNEDIIKMGFDPEYSHPKNLIICSLLIIPPVSRPYVISDGMTCDDDLTIQYIDIIKNNNSLSNEKLHETKKTKLIQSIKFRIKCLFDNSHEKAKHTNGRPYKGIKKRLAGKEGLIRNNLMGKRVNKSARSVIGPDPTLRLDEIIVPRKISKILTWPVNINRYNIEKMEHLVNDGKANFIVTNSGETRINLKYALYNKGTPLLVDDVIVHSDESETVISKNNYQLKIGDKIKRNGKFLEKVVIPYKKYYKLKIGDIVERHLQDGDIVLLNRQPTLHKGSMIAQKIKILDCKTIRMNLAITKTFNADFDGDEMNIHVPKNPETECELRELSSVRNMLISSQSSKPNIAVVQDSLLGSYLMTKNKEKLTKDTFFQICMSGDNFSVKFIMDKIQTIRKVMKLKGKKVQAFNGKGLFSLLLPDNLIYEKTNNAMKDEPTVKIYRGVLYEGAINKAIIGSSHNSLTQILNKEYNSTVAINFVNNVQFIANAWLLHNGFSVGISDCIATKTSEINSVIMKCFMEAKGVEANTHHPRIKEIKVNASLSKARDNGMRIAKEALAEDNNFVSTVTSGSKGDYFNIAQITGLLGQQNFTGQRIQPTLNNNRRTLPHYSFDIKDKETEYESKGFIKNSFIHGLNPREFWFHAIPGREGVTDTAMKTAQSGYIQRRMVKMGEDIKIENDSTVRNSRGYIYQFQYGDDGLDGSSTIIKEEEPSICDISRLVDKLNLECEMN